MMYDICARKVGDEHCGIYMPGQYWNQVGASSKFTCCIQWPFVCEKDPEMAATMVEKYGTNMDTWPQPGCGAMVVPWAHGPAKIIELRMSDGTRQAIRAERLPQQLDDEIKEVIFEWHEAAGRITAEEILEAVPTTFPTTYPTNVPGVSKFDVQDWINKGKPTLTASGWVALCELIAQKNVKDLGFILELCHRMAAV